MNESLHQDRRSFLKSIGSTTAIAAAVPVLFNQQPAAAAVVPGDARVYGAPRFALEIDNAFAGWLQNAEGGHAVAQVVTQLSGPGKFIRKHISGALCEDIVISFDTGLPKLLDLVQRTLRLEKTRFNGAIVKVDDRSRVLSRLTFYDALLEEITFPALNAGVKDPARLIVKLVPETVRWVSASGAVLSAPAATTPSKWLTSNFRLAIDGLDCSRVTSIESLTVRQIPYPFGGLPDPLWNTTTLEFPNLVLTMAESHAADFSKWHEDYVINGNTSIQQEKTGTLSWLDPSGQLVGTLNLKGLGVIKVVPEKTGTSTDGVRRVRVEMYCEEISVKAGA